MQEIRAVIRTPVELLRREGGVPPVRLLPFLFSLALLVPDPLEFEHVAWSLLIHPVLVLEFFRPLLYWPDGSEQLRGGGSGSAPPALK